MTDENLDEFNKIKTNMQKSFCAVTKLKDEASKTVETSTDFYKQVLQLETNYKFGNAAISDISEDGIKEMKPQEFNQHMQPFKDMITSAGSFSPMLSDLPELNRKLAVYTDTGMMMSSTSSSSGIAITINATNSAKLYPHNNSYKIPFDVKNEMHKNIEIIRLELPKITPNILTDFNVFISKYSVSKDVESKYQELIGFRSTMFFKLIFGFSFEHGIKIKTEGGKNTRRDQISFFATNEVVPIDLYAPQIVIADDLYNEMSNQTVDGKSIKKGAVDEEYVDSLFLRILSSLANLLLIRRNIVID